MRRVASRGRERLARFELAAQWWYFTKKSNLLEYRQRTSRSNIIVSLTSYPPRYPTLSLTLKSLLTQSYRADSVILWIARADFGTLPEDVLNLTKYGLEIRVCEDVRSYKKLVFAVEEFPECTIVVCDDDTYYWRTWLSELLVTYRPDGNEVVAHRAHKIVLRNDGGPTAYRNWRFETKEEKASVLVFPTGIGGIVFPPGIFDRRVTDRNLFMELCPTNDDIWFYWMAALNKATFRKVKTSRSFILWNDSQAVSLFDLNFAGDLEQSGHEMALSKLIDRFGKPWAV